MADGVATGLDSPLTGDAPTGGEVPASRAGERAVAALMLLPGALIVLMGFHAGGYFPAMPAFGALVLVLILLVRIMGAQHPFEGLAPSTLVAIGALGLYALMTLISASWSHSTSRALIEFAPASR